MKQFSEQVLRRLEVLARAGDAITTDQAREVLELTVQQFNRLAAQDGFPPREQHGRRWWLGPAPLLEFARRWNALTLALTVTDIARLQRSTVQTARRMTRASTFPRPLGEVNGRDRWDRAEVEAWQRQRIGGAKLPPDMNGAPPTAPVDGPKAPKGNRSGKEKKSGGQARP